MSETLNVTNVSDHEDTSNSDADEVSGAMADTAAPLEFSTKTWCDDLTLIVEGRKLYVSKTVLALASPVFKAMFTGEFQENDKDEISLPDKQYEDMVVFLKCIYPNTCILNPITLDNVYTVLPLANEYQVQSMKSACEACLLNHLSSTKRKNDKYAVLRLACLYDLKKAKERCIDMIADQPFQEFDEAARKIEYPDDIQIKIKSMSLYAQDVKYKKSLHAKDVKYKESLDALSAKYQDISRRYETSELLVRYLGDLSGRKEFAVKKLEENVVGSYVDLRVSSKLTATTEIRVENLAFSISLTGPSYGYVNIEIETQKHVTVSGLFGIVIHNWMKSCNNFKQEAVVRFDHFTNLRESRVSLTKTASELIEEKAGFISNGNIDCTMYMFIHKK